MRVPLDYYRILGVPIQATDHRQITQAYHDRALQLPRREYSDAAITARKKLLDQAYEIISHPEKRAEYDRQLLQKDEIIQADAEKATVAGVLEDNQVHQQIPSIKINEEDFVGALLILQELGEYELVLRLGHPYLTEQINPDLENAQMVRSDLILTIALACLELSREDWQQGEYEHAATSGQTGLQLLLRENLFSSIRAEIQADLYRLRPYRILELLALPDKNVSDRRKGLHLLKEILQERGGIDGSGDDQSGLNIEEFLRFIQQLRSYLTVAEQQELFEAEVRRPSAVATYLAIYALLARGFATKKPELIFRAKELLLRLSKRQDVHLEQAVCALLLGQTEEASRALELSQEYESLAFIRENSQGDPDLLHGLCLYTERWLQNEVFSHFRDLINRETSLAEYFANQEVQNYLEKLSEENLAQNNWSEEATESNQPSGEQTEAENQSSGPVVRPNLSTTSKNLSPGGALALNYPGSSLSNSTKSDTTRKESRRKQRGKKGFNFKSIFSSKNQNNRQKQDKNTQITRAKKHRKRSLKYKKLLWIGLLIVGLGGLVFAYQILSNKKEQKQSSTSVASEEEQLLISLNKPIVAIPALDAQIIVPSGNLTENIAKEIIEAWLLSKSQAFGKNHDIDSLNNILVEPLLSQWRSRAQRAKGNNSYQEYQHSVTVRNLKINQQNSNQAKVEAAVREIAKYYQNEKLIEANSYDANLIVSYDLIRQKNQWFIREIKLIQ